jgi:hypothetical protein
MRLAVESYATQHRRQAEEEARGIVADAERQTTEMRKASEETVRQVETDVKNRQERLRAEVRMLEQRKRDALERLEEIAALIQDVVPKRERRESMVSDLKPEPQAAKPASN